MADILPMHSDDNLWQLDISKASDSKRERWVRKNVERGKSEHFNIRISSFHIHRLSTIVEKNLDPQLETKADIFEDAIALWLEVWDEDHPDGAEGTLSNQSQLQRLSNALAIRESFMETAEQLLDKLKSVGATESIKSYIPVMCNQREQWRNDGTPDSILESLDKIIEKARRLI